MIGTKKAFMEHHFAEWKTHVQAGKPGKFYTKMAKKLVAKYRDLVEKGDFEEDTEDPDDDALELVMNEYMEEEQKAIPDCLGNIQKVSKLFLCVCCPLLPIFLCRKLVYGTTV